MLERYLYLTNHPGSWGDTMLGNRQLKTLRETQPPFLLDVVQLGKDIALTGMMGMYEGLVDTFHLMPDGCGSHEEDYAKYLDAEFSRVKFDRLLLGWFYDISVKNIIDQATPLDSLRQIYALANHNGYTQELPGIDTVHYEETVDYFYAWSVDQAVEQLISTLPDKPIIAIHPFSTRPHSLLTAVGIHKVAQALDEYQLVALGVDTGFYSEYTPVGYTGIFKHAGIINFMGLSPLKQLGIMKHCKLTIVTPTGAIVWPLLYGIKTICIDGGEWSANHWMKTSDKLIPCRTTCDMFPCDGNEATHMRYPKCESIPMCLGEDIDTELLKRVIKENI